MFDLIGNLSLECKSTLKIYKFSGVIINIAAEISNLSNQSMFSNIKLQLTFWRRDFFF